MRKETRTVVYDDELQIEAYRFEGIVQPFPNHFHEYYVIGFVENGSWTPMAAKIMKAAFEKSKNITFADTTVTIRSAVDETSEAQIVALAKEMK